TNLEGAGAVCSSIGVAGIPIRAGDGAGESLLVIVLDTDQAVVGGILLGACRGSEGSEQDGSKHNRESECLSHAVALLRPGASHAARTPRSRDPSFSWAIALYSDGQQACPPSVVESTRRAHACGRLWTLDTGDSVVPRSHVSARLRA